ncbi:MAG: hypothetical protein GY801_00055 [bacterium]|nr:hypothetical protein [bacterium]
MNTSTKIAQTSFLKQCVWVLTITLVVGILIELIQGNIGRTPSVEDLLKDVTGSLIVLVFWVPSRHSITKRTLRMLQGGVISLILVALLPFIKTFADETVAARQFPLLASFETPFEVGRWGGNSDFAIEHTIAGHGHSSLQVLFNTDRYSGVFLIHFPGDWRNFNFLQVDIFNPSSELLTIHFRVHDRLHIINNFPYDDRFNSTFTVNPGWNDMTIPLEDILNAPRSRTMDLTNICNVGIFVVRLAKPEMIYIDRVRLTEESSEDPNL